MLIGRKLVQLHEPKSLSQPITDYKSLQDQEVEMLSFRYTLYTNSIVLLSEKIYIQQMVSAAKHHCVLKPKA